MRTSIRPIAAAMSLAALTSCVDAFQTTTPGGTPRAALSIAPRFSESATRASATLAQAGHDYNTVRIVIVRPANDTLKDTTIAFTAASPEVMLELSVAAIPSELLKAALQFRKDNQELFSGRADVKAIALTATSSATPTEVVVNYTGPGSTATSVSIQPGSGVYTANASTQFTAKALDAANAEVPGTPITWSLGDTSRATINATGLLTPKGQRGSVDVIATTPTGLSKTITVELAPVSVGLRVVQGAGQRGAPGSTLALPVIVEAFATDGLTAPGAGATVTFSASGSAQITPASVTLDANGRAQATMHVGTTPGVTYIYTATANGFSVSWGGTAAVGTPTHFVPSGSTTLTLQAGVVPDTIPTLRVADDQENSVPGVALRVTIQKNGTNVIAPFTVPADSIGLLEVYRVAPTVAGTYTVLVESANITPAIPSITYTVTVEPGPAAKIMFGQQPGGIASGQTITPALKVGITDSFGNVVSSASGTIAVEMDLDGATNWSLGGTRSVATVNGIATFADLQVTTTSTTVVSGAKIRAMLIGFPAVSSAAFNITP
jgi:hypothetical protein